MSESELPRRPERKATLRLGQRELSLITLAVILITVVGLGFALYRVYHNLKTRRDLVIAQDNLHRIYTAIHSGYAMDWDNHLPPAEKWTDAVAGYLSAPPNTPGGGMSYLHGPGDTGEPVGYVYNDLASGYNLETGRDKQGKPLDPSHLVLLFERPGAPPNAHVSIPLQESAESEAALYRELSFPHHADDPQDDSTVILYADGSVVIMHRRDFK